MHFRPKEELNQHKVGLRGCVLTQLCAELPFTFYYLRVPGSSCYRQPAAIAVFAQEP